MATNFYYPGQNMPANPIGFDNTDKPPDAFRNERARATSFGDRFDQYYRDSIPMYGQQEQDYRRQADLAYMTDVLGYTPEEASQIIREQEMMEARVSPEQAQTAADWTPGEKEAYGGDPYAPLQHFDKGELLGTAEDIGGRLRGTVSEGASRIREAIDPNELRIDPEFAANYGLSDEEVDDISYLTGRAAGNRIQSGLESVERAARAEGATNPMAMAAARLRFERQAAREAGDATLEGRLGARQAQLDRMRDLEAMRQSAATGATGMVAGAERDILGAGLGAEGQAGDVLERTSRFTTEFPAEYERYGESERSRRAGDVADVGRGARIYGLEEPYQRTMETGDRLSGRTSQVAEARRGGEAERRGHLTGQQVYAGGRLGQAEQGRTDAFRTTAGASQGAAEGMLRSRQPSWYNRNAAPIVNRLLFPGG